MIPSATGREDAALGHLIGGRSIASAAGDTFPTHDPATGEVLAVCARGTPADIDAAVFAARSAQPAWAALDPSRRAALLHALAELIERNAGELAELESRDVGKPITEASTRDLPFTVSTWRYYAGWPTKILGTTNPAAAGVFTCSVREPLGVCGVITPWNFPLTIASWKIAPALACGNTVVHKPAAEAPMTALRLAELAIEAGIPEGVLNVVTGDREAGRALAEHPDVDALSFTGSTDAGIEIQRATAGSMKRLTLELGGKSANIVLADADLDAAVRGAISSTFRNQGEICTAGARLIVEREIARPLIDALADHVAGIRLGRGLDPETQMGPLISERHQGRVIDLFDSARNEGAEVVVGGGRAEVAGCPLGHFVQPTIFAGTSNQMRINREEIFGPAVAVIEVDSPEQAVSVANDTPYGLAAGIFTRDGGRALRMARTLRAGTVWINMYGGLDPYSTFSGRGMSGHGYELGPESIGEYTAVKTIKTAVGT
jgi:acyl-CoA reductase-like NAD-dependent aldehyde dehydrogenase